MSRPRPISLDEWVKEIDEAFQDARDAKFCGRLIGQKVVDADLFHMAPLVCLKFRGLDLAEKERDRVIEVALANYVVNTEPDALAEAQVQGVPDLKTKPKLAFALCYVAAHLAVGLFEDDLAEDVLLRYEAHLAEESI